jgi:hypothetical protein
MKKILYAVSYKLKVTRWKLHSYHPGAVRGANQSHPGGRRIQLSNFWTFNSLNSLQHNFSDFNLI